MGLALGWQMGLLTVFLANLIGCLVIIPGLATGKLRANSQVPFGPLLIAGFVVAGVFGHQLLDWYLNIFI